MQYAIVIEKGATGFGAYAPGLPGCVAVAGDEAEVRDLVREAIDLHLEGLREDGAWRGTAAVDHPACRIPAR